MKFNSLQFGKAMSAALFVLLLSVAGMKNALAQNQVATLQHGEEMSAYYGMNALVEAHAAAIDGDVITLSSGTFAKTDITKAITLHGAGCAADTLGNMPTLISGGFSINVPNDSIYLIIEGIFFQNDITYRNNLYYAKFIKCRLNNLLMDGWARMFRDVQFVNCMIDGYAVIWSDNYSVSFINCAIASLKHSIIWYGTAQTSTCVHVYNSIIGQLDTRNTNNIPSGFNLYNSIIGPNYRNVQVSDSYAYNCIEIDTVFSSSVLMYNCMRVNSYSDVFESFDGTFSQNADYHLKEEIVTSFLGNDGREVGIYGGAMPYDPRPSYLILNRCNVANRSTIDGKLSVDIEVIISE